MLAPRRVAVLLAVLAACGGTSVDPTDGPCADYCSLVMRNCTGNFVQYSAIDNCEATCRTFEVGDPEVHTGNTIECRTFWAAVAEGDKTACTKAGPGGDGQCGMNCDSFCRGAIALCEDEPAEKQPYDSAAECMSACIGYNATFAYSANETMFDTLACRIYHMTAASTDPDLHCPHTGVVSATCMGPHP